MPPPPSLRAMRYRPAKRVTERVSWVVMTSAKSAWILALGILRPLKDCLHDGPGDRCGGDPIHAVLIVEEDGDRSVRRRVCVVSSEGDEARRVRSADSGLRGAGLASDGVAGDLGRGSRAFADDEPHHRRD